MSERYAEIQHCPECDTLMLSGRCSLCALIAERDALKTSLSLLQMALEDIARDAEWHRQRWSINQRRGAAGMTDTFRWIRDRAKAALGDSS